MARAKYARIPKQQVPCYGIAEWYGQPFALLSSEERKKLAQVALNHTKETAPECPFRAGMHCSKKGGVCSIRLYESNGDGSAKVANGSAGAVIALCPQRFKQDGIIYHEIGDKLIGCKNPAIVGEVRFLKRTSSEPALIKAVEADAADDEEESKDENEDVGNIDSILVDANTLSNWCAMELQAVYFSGRAMSGLFKHVADFRGDGIPFPDRNRRPDFRSSGPKRLMPQLQIKIPALRRWGKKMAVVVDSLFFSSLGKMDSVDDISNCDIVWYVLGYDETKRPYRLKVNQLMFQTLERAVEGLTGGVPTTKADFETKIVEKLKQQVKVAAKSK